MVLNILQLDTLAPKVHQETLGRKDFHPGFLVSEPMCEAHFLRF